MYTLGRPLWRQALSPVRRLSEWQPCITLNEASMSITLFLSALLMVLGIRVGNGMRTSFEVARVRQTAHTRRRRRAR
jgi:hypothetical protein